MSVCASVPCAYVVCLLALCMCSVLQAAGKQCFQSKVFYESIFYSNNAFIVSNSCLTTFSTFSTIPFYSWHDMFVLVLSANSANSNTMCVCASATHCPSSTRCWLSPCFASRCRSISHLLSLLFIVPVDMPLCCVFCILLTLFVAFFLVCLILPLV